MRDELGIDQAALSRPIQAAWTSAASFASFAMVPIGALLAAPSLFRIPAIAGLSLASVMSNPDAANWIYAMDDTALRKATWQRLIQRV
jgi:hypothetical protein